MNKKALLVGINYPGTNHALRGCVNDVMSMSDMITRSFGFTNPQNKRMLTDASATTANILERLEWLVDGAQPGDVLLFHFSGHGSSIINQNYDIADYEPDGMDEIICPIDLDWRDKVIRDDDMKRVFDKVPAGVNLTVVLDCCHSGGGIDGASVMHPLGVAPDTRPDDPMNPNRSKQIYMPADIANRGLGLDLKPRARSVQSQSTSRAGILISGCQSHQTSADSFFGTRFMGAATFFLLRNLALANNDITYSDLVTKMNIELKQFGYSQRPELNGVGEQFDQKFLQPIT